ncbi:MAG: EAL domain-containing protein [Clostridiales bacterium]|nr:EAL domain-containing protein [Clostridiales bacterium]
MDYDENSIFLKNRSSFLTWSVIVTALSLSLLFLQICTFNEPLIFFCSLFLFVLTFFLNLTLGNPGFLISIGLIILQIVVYVHNFSKDRERLWLFLAGMTMISLIVIIMFRLFVRVISSRMEKLRLRALEEHSRRIKGENEALVKEAMQRTSLIVKHGGREDMNNIADAIKSSGNASLDLLTTLPNRTRIIKHLDTLIDDRISLSQSSIDTEKVDERAITIIYVAAIESDVYSSLLGHRTTDLFIQCMAHRLREKADPGDIVGRVSGNEFVIITDRPLSDGDIIDYAGKLRRAVASSLGDDGKKVFSGYACYPSDGRFPGELVNNAEIAMRGAISNPDGDNIMGYSEIRKNAPGRFGDMTVNEIRGIISDALEKDQIRMVYQPMFDRDHNLTGFESFVRWDDPDLGRIDTNDFLSAMEKTGQIFSVGKMCFERSLRMLSKINSLNEKLTLTVNLSAVQLKDGRFLDDYKKVSRDIDFIRSNLIIDIPEESLLTSFDESRNILDEISNEGITLALDNFGRGYSSLNNIPLLPISLVKLDGHFTSDLKEGSHTRYLTSSVISLLDEIGIPVDATGVENEEQFNTLCSFGCTYFQGKYLCDPMDDEKTIDFVREHL